MAWEATAEEKFKRMIDKMPVFLRPAAQKAVSEKAESLARDRGRSEVLLQDMVDAFFEATPFGFQGLMKNDLAGVGIDVTQYGHEK